MEQERERERERERDRERDQLSEIIFVYLGFTFGAHSIFEKVVGFYPLWFH